MSSAHDHDERGQPSPSSSASSSLSSPAASPSPSIEEMPHSTQQRPSTLSPSTTGMTASSTISGALSNARRPGPGPGPGPGPAQPATLAGRGGGNLPPEMIERMKAFHLQRQGAPPTNLRSPAPTPTSEISSPRAAIAHATSPLQRPSSPKLGPGGVPRDFKLPPTTGFPPSPGPGANALPLAQKRGISLAGSLPGSKPTTPGPGGKKRPGLTLSQLSSGPNGANSDSQQQTDQATTGKKGHTGGASLLEKYADYVDAKTGTLRFKGKAVLTNQGVEFESGRSFGISLDEVDTLDELGKGNYGTVYKVRHSRPRIRRPGHGLAGNRAYTSYTSTNPSSPVAAGFTTTDTTKDDAAKYAAEGTSGLVMAMKELRLELDDAKFAAIIMELDILHRCVSPFIVDFFGAFFQEGAVYICLEFMDGGSIDKLYGDGIPEPILRKITLATTLGLKFLKDDHNIIHRDVKPTNILVNTKGQVKICDFGVSGNLVASIAKTNIGCQSYMAPERIAGGGVAQAGANPGGGTYSVQSDIWSLGLSIIECALGRYPYPPETYDNIFSQLSAIVNGDPPDLPAESFSEAAHDFVKGCLMKIPKLRPTYAMLIQHAWLAPLMLPPTIQEEDEDAEAADHPTAPQAQSTTEDAEVAAWVLAALDRRRGARSSGSSNSKPALHAAPLDAVSTTSPVIAAAAGGSSVSAFDAELAAASAAAAASDSPPTTATATTAQ